MANSLLDFVLSLVRDPDAAARYVADPDQAIADANLTGVSSGDVDNLIPVVSESLPMGGSAADKAFGGADAADNVWASGAATTAFDAFADSLPEPVVEDIEAWTHPVIDASEPALSDGIADPATTIDGSTGVSLQLDDAMADEISIVEAPLIDDWNGVVAEVEPVDDTGSGFDLFD